MSNAAVIIPFPSAPARQTETAESIAAAYLRAKRAAAEAEEQIKALAPKLTSALRAEGEKGVAIPGLGAVTLYESAPAMRLDTRKATEMLQQHKLEVPLAPTGGGLQLRATLVR